MSQYPPPRRLAFPKAEAAQPWLAALLDAYREIDRLLPFHGIRSKGERWAAVREGRLHALARPLQGVDWKRLALRMGEAPRAGGDGASG